MGNFEYIETIVLVGMGLIGGSILKAIKLVPDARTFSFEGGHNIINSRTKEIVSLINDFIPSEATICFT